MVLPWLFVMAAPRIGRAEVQHLMHDDAQVLDALPPDDYRAQHLPGAINVPVEKFSPELLRGLDLNRATITYCADNECDLSARLAALLVMEGFTEVYEYANSLADWGAYGLRLEGETQDIARARDLARTDFPTCSPDEPAAAVSARLDGHSLCAVVDGEGVLLGRVTADDLKTADASAIRDVMSPGASTFRPDVHLDEMAEWFKKRPKIDAFIITTPDARPLGILYRSDTEEASRREAARLSAASAGNRH